MPREEMGDRIRQAREAVGLSQAELAERVAVSQPTVWEWENNQSQPKRFRVKRIAKALGRDSEWIERGSVPSYQKLSEDGEEVPVIGAVQAGAWMEAYQLPKEDWTYMTLPSDPRYPGIPRYGLKNEGPSMNKRLEPGGTWVFVRYEDIRQEPQAGQYVVAERVRRDGLVEATCKRLAADGAGKLWLWPESTDPRHQAPLALDGDQETAEIRLIGRVTRIVGDV